MDFSTLLANAGADFSLQGMWEQMGIIAKFVMVLLLLMFLLSLALMIERSRAYSRAKRQSISYIMLLRNFLQERKLQEAVTAAGQHADSPLAKVVGAGMGEYLKGMEALQEEGPEDVGDFDLVDAVNRQLERSKERETANLKRGLTVLATVGSTSVFVGLFGTVVGIITAFQGISADGGGGLSSVAGGISEALVATAVGLMVAIPSVVAFNLFNGRVEAFQIDMNDVASELIDFVLKEGRY
ncbi:MAG: MotA/TolQ/ExbB proton channel family protein [Nannocystis sp.]|nr:MotA/TolQ/ExbB proton channel family protein [Nannocystis sp.]MBA3545533.1 MotA/TolQ/ExbB proton channel family protein [Nannocystis sp.]